MNTTTIEWTPEVEAPEFNRYNVSEEEIVNQAERLRHASMTREVYRREAMRQIKDALASFK